MTKQEILAAKTAALNDSMKEVYAFLKDKYEYEGQVLKYDNELTEGQQEVLQSQGWTVQQKNNGVDKYGYRSWIEIS